MGGFKRAEMRRRKREQEKLGKFKTAIFGGTGKLANAVIDSELHNLEPPIGNQVSHRIGAIKRAKATLDKESYQQLVDTAYRLDTVETLVSMGMPEDMAPAMARGLERAMDEELQRVLETLRKAVAETVEIMEIQICEANLVLFLRAVEKTFGSLKTVQRGYEKLMENYNAVVEEAEETGIRALSQSVRERTGLDYEVEDIDLAESYRYWDVAIQATKELGKAARQKTGERKMRLVDLDKLDIAGKTLVMKVLDKWQKEHPLTEIELDSKEWDVILERQGEEFKTILRTKGENR